MVQVVSFMLSDQGSAVKYACYKVCVLAADQSSKADSYSKCWPTSGGFYTGPGMRGHTQI